MYWLQQLQMRRWEFCNAQSRFPVGSSQLVNEPLAGRTSKCHICQPSFCFQPPQWWMVLFISHWAEVLARFFKPRCQLSMLGWCLELLALLELNMDGLFPNPHHVVGVAQISYDGEFSLDFPHACELWSFGISPSSCEACEFTARRFFSVVGWRCAFLAVGVHRLVDWEGHKQGVHMFSCD